MDLNLNGKVVLITGATRGIGADIALGFAEEGAQVAICARTKADLDARASEIAAATKATVVGFPVDLSKRSEPERLVAEVVKRFGKPVTVVIEDAAAFWPAENYHQNYCMKNPLRYKTYRAGCGRDARLKELWGNEAAPHGTHA